MLTPVISLTVFITAAAEPPIGADQCPQLFGDDVTVHENRALRQTKLRSVLMTGDAIILDQTYDWNAPEETEIDGLELVETSTEGAYVQLDADWVDCPSGVYRVTVDDAVGEDGMIIAIVDDALVFEHEGELLYLRVDGAPEPQFEVTWSSGYSMNPYLTKKRGRVHGRSAQARRARARAKARARRRR